MAAFYNIWKNYNEIQLTKYKMDLNNRKMEKNIHPPVTMHHKVNFIIHRLYLFS